MCLKPKRLQAANAIEIDPTGDPFSAGAWNPHSSNLVATGIGRDVCVWDLRAKPQRWQNRCDIVNEMHPWPFYFAMLEC